MAGVVAAGLHVLLLLILAALTAPVQLVEPVSINGELIAGSDWSSLTLVERYLLGNGSGHGEAILSFNNTVVMLKMGLDYKSNVSALIEEEDVEYYIYTNGSMELRGSRGHGSSYVRIAANTSEGLYGGSAVVSYELRRSEDEARLLLSARRGLAQLGGYSIEFSLDLVLVQNWAINYSWIDVKLNASSRDVEPLTKLYLWLKSILPEDAPKPRPPRPGVQGVFVLQYSGRIPLGSLAVPSTLSSNMSLSVGPIKVLLNSIKMGYANYTIEVNGGKRKVVSRVSLEVVLGGKIQAVINGANVPVEEGSSRLVLRGFSAEHRLNAKVKTGSMADYVPLLAYVSEALAKSSGLVVVRGTGGVIVFDPVSGSLTPSLTLTKDKPWAVLVKAGIGYGLYQGSPAVVVLEEPRGALIVPRHVAEGWERLRVIAASKAMDSIAIELEAPINTVEVWLGGEDSIVVEGVQGVEAVCLGRVEPAGLPENLELLAAYNITVSPPQSLEIVLPAPGVEEDVLALTSIDGGQSWTLAEASVEDGRVVVKAEGGRLLLALAVEKPSPAQPQPQQPQGNATTATPTSPVVQPSEQGGQASREEQPRTETPSPPSAATGAQETAEKRRRDVSDVLTATVMVLVMVFASALIARKSA